MRIALNAVGEIGTRVGRILSAERDLSALGLFGEHAGIAQDRRIVRISTLDGFDALVTDDPDGSDLAAIAVEDGLSCAIPGEPPAALVERFAAAGRALVVGCGLAGLAETLATHEAARTTEPLDTMVAWTVEGKPTRRGTPIAFPDPVGARWGRRSGDSGSATRVVVPVDGPWAGAAATVVGITDGETVRRIVGVADASDHLKAISLAAGAVVAATTDLVGLVKPGDVAAEYLSVALRMGLGVATYTLD